MKGQIFNFNKPVAHNGRNGFDLSSQHVFDMRPSVIRPVITQFTVPNSSYRINCADLVRTGALQTAAFLRGKQELDFFFVPFSQLFSYSNDIIFGRHDYHSTALHEDVENMPTCPLIALVYNAYLPYVVCRIWHDLNDLNCLATLGVEKKLKDVTVREFCQILLAGIPNAQIDYNVNYFCKSFFYDCYDPDSLVSTLNFVGSDVCKLLSSLGYGDYQSYFDIAYNRQMALYIVADGGIDTITSSDQIEGFLRRMDLSINCFDMYVDNIDFNDTNFISYRREVSILPLLAYHKVFYDYYRDSVNDNSDLYLYSYNADAMDFLNYWTRIPFYDTAVVPSDNQCLSLTLLLPMRRMFKKDLSTGLYPSSQFGDFGNQREVGDYFDDADELGASSQASAYSIQFALAMQRYRQMLLRAGNRTKDLLMAEFGVKSHYINDTYCKYLGSFNGSLVLNKVSATAEVGDYSVGDLTGNVFSSLTGDTIEFTCNDHGIIIGCLTFLAEPLHNATGISPFLFKTSQYDFFHEEFENLGLQPVSSLRFSPSYVNGENGLDFLKTLGFSARYNEYKQNIDQVHDTFMVAPMAIGDDIKRDWVKDGVNSNYVCVRNPYQTVSDIRYRSYMLPDCMDTIFKDYDTGLPEDSHFQVTLDCQITAVLPMSVMGLI